MTDGRYAAFTVLSKIDRDKSYSNLVLSDVLKDSELADRELSLTHRIVKTVIERKITIDYNLSLYLKQPLKKLKPQVLTVLRMGAGQILFMDKIPSSAAVNECVSLCKKSGNAFASGVVNAVLRKIAVNGLVLPENTGGTEYLSVKYSFPADFCDRFISYYGWETAEKIMASSLEESPIYIRKNNLKSEELSDGYEKCDTAENCYVRKIFGDMTKEMDFIRGLYHVQDLSSQLCCKALAPKAGETVIDICASPGGKTATIAEMMNNQGKIIACDIYNHRLKLIEDTVKRLGIDIVEVRLRDGRDKNSDLPIADKILCDVPCSGLGVTSKKPEIKYKSSEEIQDLPALQLEILENSSRFLKTGGRLVYSTCTLLPEENINVCKEFLSRNENFDLVSPYENLQGFYDGGTLTVLPHIYRCDGFFTAVFERKV
ncbi:MAG: 16S rRNA (cytosine(967)-C(5))-methyltransferase RsmB [Clostridiales bacterium]|nr:16S rRNA (cytosine(967)-C(5))-methyltransferase RsmB [Clostridiales bacterium]